MRIGCGVVHIFGGTLEGVGSEGAWLSGESYVVGLGEIRCCLCAVPDVGEGSVLGCC